MASAQEVVKRGYLTKSPPARQALAKWKRRWCMVLDSHLVYPLAPRYLRLEYFEDEEAHMAGKDPKGVVDLKDCQQVKRSSNVKNHKNVFDIVTTERVYHMSADSAAEKQEWVEALHGILSNDEEAFASRTHLYNTRQIAPVATSSILSPTRYQRSTTRSVSPVVNRRAVESQSQSQSHAPSYTSTRANGNHYSPGPASYARTRRSISDRVRDAIEKEKEVTNQSQRRPSSRSSSSDDRPRRQTVSSPSASPSEIAGKRLTRTQSAHVGAMGDYDMAAPRQDSDSDDEIMAGPVSIRPQESVQKQQSLQRQCLSPRVRGADHDDSESEDEASGPTSVVSQEPSQADLQSDPLAQAYVPSASAVAKRFSLHADIDLSERCPDYHNLSYPEDAPEKHVGSKDHNYKNIVFTDSPESSPGGKVHDYKNLVFTDAPESSPTGNAGSKVGGKVHDYKNLVFSDTQSPTGTGSGQFKKHGYQNVNYPDSSGGVQPPRAPPKNIGSGNEDFQMMTFSGGSKPGAKEDQYEQLPSHSHLSSVAGTMSYPSVGTEARRVETSRGPVAAPRRDLPKSKPAEHPDYDFAAPRVGTATGNVLKSKQPAEHADYDFAAPHHGTFVGNVDRTKPPAEHPDYDFAAPHVSSLSRVPQYDYVQPKPQKSDHDNPFDDSLKPTHPVQRLVQYDYVQPKPRPRKEGVSSRLESVNLPLNESEPFRTAGQKDNYEYVVPGARLTPSRSATVQEWKKPGFSDYDKAAPRQSTKALAPEADGDYHFAPEAAPPKVDGDYDIVGFRE